MLTGKDGKAVAGHSRVCPGYTRAATQGGDARRLYGIACTPERRRSVYRSAAEKLQKFADAHPAVRHDIDTPEISRAAARIDKALALFMEGAYKREQVSIAFDEYKHVLIAATTKSTANAASDKYFRKTKLVMRTLWTKPARVEVSKRNGLEGT